MKQKGGKEKESVIVLISISVISERGREEILRRTQDRKARSRKKARIPGILE